MAEFTEQEYKIAVRGVNMTLNLCARSTVGYNNVISLRREAYGSSGTRLTKAD